MSTAAPCSEGRPGHLDIRIHARAGQGALTTARLLAVAAWLEGWHPLAFPHFGAERMGAPMNAYVRLGRQPVRGRQRVTRPGLVLVLDPRLLDHPSFGVLTGVHAGTLGLVNAEALPAALAGVAGRWLAVPASRLALQNPGADRPNVPLLGALAVAGDVVSLAALERTVEQEMAAPLRPGNLAALRAGFAWVREHVARPEASLARG